MGLGSARYTETDHGSVRIQWWVKLQSYTSKKLSWYTAGGTHVKWNRQNGNILASSHQDQVLIWDRRVRIRLPQLSFTC